MAWCIAVLWFESARFVVKVRRKREVAVTTPPSRFPLTKYDGAVGIIDITPNLGNGQIYIRPSLSHNIHVLERGIRTVFHLRRLVLFLMH